MRRFYICKLAKIFNMTIKKYIYIFIHGLFIHMASFLPSFIYLFNALNFKRGEDDAGLSIRIFKYVLSVHKHACVKKI